MSNPDTTIRRARSMLGVDLRYVLGAGGRKPAALTPATERDGVLGCDCVGFTAWASGFDRFQKAFPYYGGWINCDSALGKWDAQAGRFVPARGWFELLTAPEPGCWVVYPSIDLDNDGKRDRIGHVGIVSEVPAKGWAWSSLKVVQCSSTASKRTNGTRAVVETDASLWGRAGVYRGRSAKRWQAAFLMPLI